MLKALELDDTSAQAHVTLANVKVFEWDWATADKEFRRLFELNPNSAEAHFMYADFLITMRRTAEWAVEIRRTLELATRSVRFNRCFYGVAPDLRAPVRRGHRGAHEGPAGRA